MRIDRAILVKEAYLRNPLCNLNGEERVADQMSIEALKRIENPLQYNLFNPRILLPSETKD